MANPTAAVHHLSGHHLSGHHLSGHHPSGDQGAGRVAAEKPEFAPPDGTDIDPAAAGAMIQPAIATRPGAPVAELVDAADSKSVEGNLVLVRVRPGAPINSMSYEDKSDRQRNSVSRKSHTALSVDRFRLIRPKKSPRRTPPAEQGDADARFNLGAMHVNGEGVPRDYAEAMKWFRKATGAASTARGANLLHFGPALLLSALLPHIGPYRINTLATRI